MTQPFSYQEAQQRGAVAALVGRCEKIVGMGCLPDSEEARLRALIVETCNVFGMLTVAERPVVQVGDHDPEYVRKIDTVAEIVGAPQFDGAA